jgi:hypothetical protein
MPGEVLALFAYDLPKPLADFGVVHIVIVYPALIAGIVRRIYVDALNAALVPGQQGFEGLQIVAVDNHVGAAVILRMLPVLIEAILPLQDAIRHFLMMVNDFVLPYPV